MSSFVNSLYVNLKLHTLTSSMLVVSGKLNLRREGG